MAIKPKHLTSKFIPGLGVQHEVGLTNVGASVVDCTIVADNATVRTNAQLIGSAPNTNANVNACGPIVHSLGAAPTAAFLFGCGTLDASVSPITAHFVTADNSAVYFRARTWTAFAVGYAVRMVAIRKGNQRCGA